MITLEEGTMTEKGEIAARDAERLAAKDRIDLPKISAASIEQKSEITTLPLEDLLIDTDYQRNIDPDRVSRMAHAWNPDLVGIIVVNQRENGKFYVVDGQHRVAAMNRLDNYPETVVVQLFRGLDKEEEALLFWKLDSVRANLTTGAAFKARLVANDADALAIFDAGLKAGFQMDPALGNIPGNLRCWATLDQVYRRVGASGLTDILTILRQAWPNETNAGSAPVIRGMELFANHYGNRIDKKRLLIALRSTTPEALVARARAMSQTMSSAVGEVVAINILGLYNRGLSSNRLPEWYEFEQREKRSRKRAKFFAEVEEERAAEIDRPEPVTQSA